MWKESVFLQINLSILLELNCFWPVILHARCCRGSAVRATTRSEYMMTSSTFAKWRPRRETRGKVTSRLFAAPRSVFSPYYFESCDFRQWEIRGVKKKCRPMNVCAFLGGKTTEHKSCSAQRNARQGAKHLKKEGEFQFSDPWKQFFWNLHKICLLMVVLALWLRCSLKKSNSM